jgi:hypothetical protein
MEMPDVMVEKKNQARIISRILIFSFFLAVILSVGVSFLRFFVLRDYMIQAQASCDPRTEVCFIYHCDPSAEECTGDEVADTSYYKLIDRNAQFIPTCNPTSEGCAALECPVDEPGCVVTFCTPDNPDGIECTTPETYREEHPIIEEGQGGPVSDAAVLPETAPDQSQGSEVLIPSE